MERINQTELSRVVKSSEPLGTLAQLPSSSEEAIQQLRQMGAPQWSIRVLEMAQDKRHDLAPHSLRFWKEKLSGIPDELVCEALMTGRWQLFPSVDDVIIRVEEIRERRHQVSGEQAYAKYKREQREAKSAGLLATDADYEAMRAKLRELFGDPTVRVGDEPSQENSEVSQG